MKYYQRIKSLREQKGMNQTQIAKLIECSQVAYSHYELGKRDIPTATLIKLADIFDTSIDFILERTDNPEPPKS